MDALKGGMEDVNKLLLETEAASVNMVTRLSDLSSIANKGGIVRSIITRATAGIPSVYQLMQQLSSMLLVFRYLVIAKKQDLKQEQEMIEGLKRKEDVQRRLYKLSQAMGDGNMSAMEKERFYNDASIKHLMRTMDFQKALNVTKEKFLTVQEKIIKSDDKVFKVARKNFVKQNYGSQGLTGGNLLGKAGILMADKTTSQLEERQSALEVEKTASDVRLVFAKLELDKEDLKESEKRRIKAEIDLYEARSAGLSDSIDKISEEIAISNDNVEGMIKNAGFKTFGGSGNRSFQDLSPSEIIRKKLDEKFGKFIEGFKTFQAGFKMFFSKGNMVMLKNTLMMAGSFFKYALFAITGLGVIIYMLQKIGFFEKTGEALSEVGKVIGSMKGYFASGLEGIMEHLPKVLSGLMMLLNGLFSGDGSKMLKGLTKVALSFLPLLLSVTQTVLSGLGIILTGLLGGLVSVLWGLIYGAVDTMIVGFKNLIENPKAAIKGTGAGVATGVLIGGIGGAAIGSFAGPGGTLAGLKVGAVIGGSIGGWSGMSKGMASGGTNLLGGAYLVGENGPETVLLPGGSSVINNTNTRGSMGNTIHVHVNGRIGASEQELNQIADKIGQKISMRMNRFSPTGMRG